jgi:hypothetical protein
MKVSREVSPWPYPYDAKETSRLLVVLFALDAKLIG